MQYLVLFRGINVGGKHIIKMDDLKKFLLKEGFENIKTYLQSGNAILTSSLKKMEIYEKIKITFAKEFGFESEIVILSKDEMNLIIRNMPFSQEEIAHLEMTQPKVAHLYVYFFSSKIDKSKINTILANYQGLDEMICEENYCYLLCHESIRKSQLSIKMAKNFKNVTVRNINSVNKIYKLMCD